MSRKALRLTFPTKQLQQVMLCCRSGFPRRFIDLVPSKDLGIVGKKLLQLFRTLEGDLRWPMLSGCPFPRHAGVGGISPDDESGASRRRACLQ
jgi:hypothetical protein